MEKVRIEAIEYKTKLLSDYGYETNAAVERICTIDCTGGRRLRCCRHCVRIHRACMNDPVKNYRSKKPQGQNI